MSTCLVFLVHGEYHFPPTEDLMHAYRSAFQIMSYANEEAETLVGIAHNNERVWNNPGLGAQAELATRIRELEKSMGLQ